MNQQKLVSVVIPAYNVSKYIMETLSSVSRQTYKNIEIIVVNDGSTDETGSLCEKFALEDVRIQVVNQLNKGLAEARNHGMSLARGEYICIFDSDDVMIENKIEKQVEFLEINKNCDLVFSNIYHFTDDGEFYFLPLPKLEKNVYNQLLKLGNFINPNSVLFRRSAYDKFGGFDGSLRSAEDWEYWLRLASNGVRFSFSEDFLTKYRIRKGSLSGNRAVMAETTLKVLEKQPKVDSSQLSRAKLRLALAYLSVGDQNKAHKIIQTDLILKSVSLILYLIPSIILVYFYQIKNRINFRRRFKRLTIKSQD